MTRQEWFNRYDSEKTRYNAKLALKALENYQQEKQITQDEIITEPYLFLDSLVQSWKKTKGPATIRNYFSFVRSWLRTQGIRTDNYEIKNYVKFPKTLHELREPLDHKTIEKLLKDSEYRYKVYYLMLASSGMRPSECLALRKNDIEFGSPTRIHLRAETTKTGEERYTFVSAQASRFLKNHIENNEKIFDMEIGHVVDYMRELRKRTGLLEKYHSGTHKITTHSFRSFFRTVIGQHNRDFAEKILGHRGYLSQYVRLTTDQLAEEYKNYEKHLMFDENRFYNNT